MKIIFTALISSIKGLLNVFLVIFYIWLIFAMIGVSLFKNRFGYCDEVKKENFFIN